MTRDQVKAILDRVLTWPPERQADVAYVVELMEMQDKSELRLSDDQAAEVRRRLANPSKETISAEEVFRQYRLSGA
jgi:16S rRNA U1498 N3-methylase RsmE